MAKLDERKYFSEHNFGERVCGLDNQATETLLTSFPKLQNIWVMTPTLLLMHKIKERGNIRHLTIGIQDEES